MTENKPDLYFRSGRIVGAITFRMAFIVDTDGSLYPQKNITECSTCVSAYVTDV